MSIRLLTLLAAVLSAVALEGQAPAPAPLPPDINPVTLSRLPPVARGDLDAEGQKLFDARPPATPGPGPGHVSRYSPRTADGQGLIGRGLGVPSGEGFPLGVRTYQLVVLITAREIDQQYEWSAHEPAGRRQGLEQSVIDVVKNGKSVAGLSDKDATLITFGRTLYREHRVSSELWAKMIGLFGRQHALH